MGRNRETPGVGEPAPGAPDSVDGHRTPVHPTHDDPVVTGLAEVVGGPAGRRWAPHRWWTPVQVLLLLTAFTFALGMTTKAACVADGWQDEKIRYTHACYSDLPYLYTWRGLQAGEWPYTDDAAVRAVYESMEYPVGISYWAWGTAKVTSWVDGDGQHAATTYLAVNAVGFALVGLLTTWLLAGVHRRRPWDAAGWALAPAVALTATINWDLLAVATVAGAAWAWARGRPGLTGVMIGLGAATKLYPVLLLGAILVLCIRQRRAAPMVRATLAAVVVWLAVNLPAVLTGPNDWARFWSFNSERAADLGSLWLVIQETSGRVLSAGLVNAGSWVVLALGCLGVLVIGLKAPTTPRFAQLAFLTLAAFLLVNKVYSPQYVLWLLPLAVLARPRWRDLLIWQAGEAVYFFVVWFHLAGLTENASGRPVVYWLAILVRVAALAWFVVAVVRDVLRPDADPVAEERGGLYGPPDTDEAPSAAAAEELPGLPAASDAVVQSTSTLSLS